MKSTAPFFLLAFFLWLPLDPTWAVVIRLHSEAKVSGLRVELGGIADIECEDEKTMKLLKKICLMPLPYSEKLLTSQEIQRRLAYQFKDDFVFIGDKILLKPVFTRILDTEIMEKIRTAVLKKFPELSYDKMEISLLDTLQPIKIPYGEIEIKPHIPENKKMKDIHFVRADIFVDNTLFTSRSFRIKLSFKKS